MQSVKYSRLNINCWELRADYKKPFRGGERRAGGTSEDRFDELEREDFGAHRMILECGSLQTHQNNI